MSYHVESPDGSPNGKSAQEYHAGLDELARQATASVAETKQVEGQIRVEQSRAEGQKIEEKRDEAGAQAEVKNTGSTEGTLAAEIAGNTLLGTGAQIVSAGLSRMSEKESSPSQFSAKEAKGLGVSSGGRTMDQDFTKMRNASTTRVTGIESLTRGKSLMERMGITEKSLGDQGGTNVGTVANAQNAANLTTSATMATSLVCANEKVLGQVMAAKAQNAHLPQGPGGMGSNAPKLENNKLACGPGFISPEEAERAARSMETDKSESWA